MHSCRYDKFKKRSSECWKTLLQEIQAAAGSAELESREISAGAVYSPDGLLFDPWVLDIINFPECMYLDSAHCILGSGSIGQFTINQFVRELVGNTTVALEDLSAHVATVKFHQDRSRLPKQFFQERINLKPRSNMRGFASETISVVEA